MLHVAHRIFGFLCPENVQLYPEEYNLTCSADLRTS